jgi:MerR family copper efflux transcriptional regulator
MNVSELARKAGTTAKTIRFYEAEGVLPAPPRKPNGYREYDEGDLCRTRVVVSLRNLGIDLAESGRLGSLCATGECDVMAGDLVERVGQRRREVAVAIAELLHLDRELAALEEALTTGAPPTHLCLGKEVTP